jgi:hypothetical protein
MSTDTDNTMVNRAWFVVQNKQHQTSQSLQRSNSRSIYGRLHHHHIGTVGSSGGMVLEMNHPAQEGEGNEIRRVGIVRLHHYQDDRHSNGSTAIGS